MNNMWLEASSFVHLIKKQQNQIRMPHQHQHQHQQHDFLEQQENVLQLLEIAFNSKIDHAEKKTEDENNNNNFNNKNKNAEICFDCMDMLSTALETDTQRLYAETEAYEETILSSNQRMEALIRTTEEIIHQTSFGTCTGNSNRSKSQSIEDAYQQEIDMLRQEIEIQGDELIHLKKLHKEQNVITTELTLLEEGLQIEHNSLEFHSKVFDDRMIFLTRELLEVENEAEKLMCVSLPRALFDVQIDHLRGLHYPLINHLRLAFQPKGDVSKQEIQTAWSQATQLLLVLATIFEYHSQDWKLVPLVNCAKLIYRKEIFNLSPGDCRSLMAWNALLDQVVKHALSIVKSGVNNNYSRSNRVGIGISSPNTRIYESTNDNESNNSNVSNTSSTSSFPPFPSSPTMIGGTELARVEPSNDVGWSLVINFMASNLLWLSNQASDLATTQVGSMAQCVV